MTDKALPVLEARAVAKHYGALAAVDGIDLKVMPGQTIGIGGPNGAGKTTFFDLISGFIPVTKGEVLFMGEPIKGLPAHHLARAGLVRTFQVTSGFTSLTVWQNMMASVIFGARDTKPGLLFNRGNRARVETTLEAFGLSDLASARVEDIPALARKKLMVATAIVHEPKVLLLDEPVSGLMPSEVDEFISLMHEIRARGTTLVFIEHVMRFLTSVADRALIMHQGKLIYDGPPSGIGRDETVRSVYLGGAAYGLETETGHG
ncbi:ABC transporter ATP-binding protein [Lutimaribacter saemankumensis]|uniref:Branched-chain amino acid transport system ATP-binding protein n=1 Tax=Lutimaribacter saemankumensis TaxID=490829 RepID=A0A1G8T6C4_9RHOB|nr:ATP-binding cassette domain-containing protein [Lutimaribacter saemankumensis]SDJ36967.1 branched-chain amino acid transport system ATP-binding protein [Lutimaribacter saemankumensis]